ncbi:three component ABC system middle component [Microbulbifer taiwanensis]|uniref:Three component ABC system middle component n=1 Tax=Microbulbifer taiwanensis TaxID=986746 RepID=A0ABW1YS40_9GAMM|nr:three component ABC system middle component [Microbulbifer taiwanensis]
MRTDTINNLAFASLAIAMVIEKSEKLELTKALLIMPFLAHKELLSYLANGKTKVRGLDKLIVDKLHCFSNFNKRYYDNLSTSLNALQFLSEVDVVSIENSNIVSREKVECVNSMGGRLKRALKASDNIAKILNEDASSLYLNLRVEL